MHGICNRIAMLNVLNSVEQTRSTIELFRMQLYLSSILLYSAIKCDYGESLADYKYVKRTTCSTI